nr:inositol-tetrakisphosphate 1-kinase-like [Lytechinus pictus]
MEKIGYWVPEKKKKKLNFGELAILFRQRGTELVELDLQKSLSDQGPFSVIFHKLTDVVTQAAKGDNKARCMIDNLEMYIKVNPDVVVLDPLSAVKNLMDRNISYQVLLDSLQSNPDIHRKVKVPNFVEIHTTKETEIMQLLRKAQVGFPLVCKPSQAHGSVISHKMSLIFNEAGLKDIRPPCVAQTFINHNALLHKVFIIGDQYFVVKRPSVKNFTIGGSDQSTIFFDSHDVSKFNSTSFLNELDETDADHVMLEPCSEVLKSLADCLHNGLQMSLIGADVIVENHTGLHYVIDVNAFPGYDGVPEFMQVLFNYIERLIVNPKTSEHNPVIPKDSKAKQTSVQLMNGIAPTLKDSIAKVEDCTLQQTVNKPVKRPLNDVVENGTDLACKKSVLVNGCTPGSNGE